jgi:ADP-ribose pyrophosphatase
MENNDEIPPTRLDRTVIYENCWVNLYRDKVALPNGHILDQYHILDFGRGSVGVIVENDGGQILMERITRYSTGMTTWELPAGGIEGSESVLNAAEREVHEETGYETYDHCEIYQYHPLIGMSNKFVHLVRCRAGKVSGKLDQDEINTIKWFDRAELRFMIQRREITDGLTLAGLLLHWETKN